MRIAIVDDEKAVLDQLAGYISQYAAERRVRLDVCPFLSGDQLLASGDMNYDIIVFDIDMPGISGLDTARKIRETDENVVILFVTNIAQYAINGYEVDAVDYIIKPVGYYDFAMKFQKAVRRAERNLGNQMVIETVDGPVLLDTDKVLYVEVMGHYVIYHTFDGDHRVRASMKEHEDALRAYHFSRCHKSYLVNLKHLKRINASEVIVGEYSVPLGRAFKDSVMADYMDYLHR